MVNFDKAKAMLDYNGSMQRRLRELGKPLKLFGISNLSYVKITRDQKYFKIGNHDGYTNLSYKLGMRGCCNGTV
jgi:hypothetical protein